MAVPHDLSLESESEEEEVEDLSVLLQRGGAQHVWARVEVLGSGGVSNLVVSRSSRWYLEVYVEVHVLYLAASGEDELLLENC